MRDWILRWGPAVFIMTVIFIASSTPGSDFPDLGIWDLLAKKAGHMLGYALLAVAYFRALDKGKDSPPPQPVIALGLAFVYALSDEFHQRFTPGRTPSIQDVGIDTLGAALGLTIRGWVVKAVGSRH